MRDQYNREINYIRISLTDRCNLKCKYCRPNFSSKLTHADILTYEEILRLCQSFVKLGIKRFKLTGGEPLLRKDCVDFLERLKKLAGVEQVTLTTNGTMLREHLPALKAIGIDGINISLDSCNAKTYADITGRDCLKEVLAALDEAYSAGLPVKINCVPLSNMQLADLLAMLELVKKRNISLRFIELMPLNCNSELKGLSGDEIRKMFVEAGIKLVETKALLGNGPAVYYQAEGFSGAIGFIEPLHNKFCHSCNRIRLTASGLLKPCLYATETFDLKALLRSGASDEKIIEVLRQAIYAKPQGHAFEISPANFPMSAIGG